MSNRPTKDTCPNCGASVKPTGTYGIGAGQPMREPDQETAKCPECGEELVRGTDGAWTKVSERYPPRP